MTALASGVGQKYTIGDVTSSPTLKQAALNFIRGYRGDFEFLVRMKEVEALQHTFTDGQTKGVLNCMQYDPQGLRYISQAKEAEMEAQEHAYPDGRPDTMHGRQSVAQLLVAADRPPLFVVRDREKLAYFDVKVRWKKFWLTTEVQGKSHHLNTEMSRATFFRETWEYKVLHRARIDFQMVTLCGLRVRSFSLFRRRRVWTLTARPTKGVCLNCERKLEEA